MMENKYDIRNYITADESIPSLYVLDLDKMIEVIKQTEHVDDVVLKLDEQPYEINLKLWSE